MLRLVSELKHRTYNKAGDERGGRRKHKIVGNRDDRSVEGIWMGRGTWGKTRWYYRDFQEGKQGI